MSFYKIISFNTIKHFNQEKNHVSSLPVYTKIIDSLSSADEPNLFYKRASVFTLLSLKKAAVSLEAAVIFPLFLCACLSMLFFIELFRIESCVNSALHSTARNLGQYVALFEAGEVTGAALMEAGMQSVGVAAAGEMVKKAAGNTVLNHPAIVNGKHGISFWGTTIDSEYIDLVVHYKVKFPVPFFSSPKIPIVQRCRLHVWSGKQQDNGLDENEVIVYITPDGSVYHKTDKCTHLKLSVVRVAYSDIRYRRNIGGAKYYPCERCLKRTDAALSVFITSEGTRYHGIRTCSGLKRTIKSVKLSDIKDKRRACSRCGG